MNQENGKERNWQHQFSISGKRGNVKVSGTLADTALDTCITQHERNRNNMSGLCQRQTR